MKKLIGVVIVLIVVVSACGPNTDELDAKRIADSTRVADSLAQIAYDDSVQAAGDAAAAAASAAAAAAAAAANDATDDGGDDGGDDGTTDRGDDGGNDASSRGDDGGDDGTEKKENKATTR